LLLGHADAGVHQGEQRESCQNDDSFAYGHKLQLISAAVVQARPCWAVACGRLFQKTEKARYCPLGQVAGPSGSGSIDPSIDMRTFYIRPALGMLLAAFALVRIGAGADNMKAFPAAANGLKRYVLNLPQTENEADLKVELVIGKTVPVEPNNKYFFGGKVETKMAEGWGFPYYVVSKLGPLAGTLMAVDPAAPKVERFISIRGETPLLRYNSKLPVVVYAPEEVEVRYRVWRAPAEASPMSPG
jgi:ecotin